MDQSTFYPKSRKNPAGSEIGNNNGSKDSYPRVTYNCKVDRTLPKKERTFKLQPGKKTLSSEYLEETHMKTILRLDEKGLLKVHQTATTPCNG